MEFYFKKETEKEFYLRNKQVKLLPQLQWYLHLEIGLFFLRINITWVHFFHAFQVKQRAIDAKQALNMLYLLNDGADIENMLEAGGINGRDFDFSQFKGSLDVESAAVMGHSFGGATTIQTLSEDPRFMLVWANNTVALYNTISFPGAFTTLGRKGLLLPGYYLRFLSFVYFTGINVCIKDV